MGKKTWQDRYRELEAENESIKEDLASMGVILTEVLTFLGLNNEGLTRLFHIAREEGKRVIELETFNKIMETIKIGGK